MFLKDKEYLRSILFGSEDSLISTTGFLAGISMTASNPHLIFVSGLIAISIEGVSMGVGEYLSDDSLEMLDKIKRHKDNPLLSGVLLSASYILSAMIPFIPAVTLAFPLSTLLSAFFAFIALFFIGYLKGRILKTSAVKSGLKILCVGGVTTLLGIVVGIILRI